MRVFRTLTVTLAALFSASGAFAQPDNWKLAEGQAILPVTPRQGLQAHVHVYLPPGFEQQRPPVIVYLHGAGERGEPPEAMFKTAITARLRARPDFPFIVVSPQLVANSSGWDPGSVHALLDEVLPKIPGDPKRLYATGMSMGGAGVWRLAFARPDRFAAIAPVSSSDKLDDACRIKSVPVWAFHNDPDQSFPMSNTTDLVQALQRCDGQARVTLYKKTGHNAWTEAYRTDALYDWLLSHAR